MSGTEKTLPSHIVAAAGVVRNEKGEILLINGKRGWEYPGGIIENGETLTEGLKREIFEETGAEVDVGELFCVSSNINSYPGYNGVETVPTKVVFDFICSYRSGELRPSDENTETRFVPESEVSGMITDGTYTERFNSYLSYNGRPRYIAYENKPDFILHESTTI